MTGNRKRFVSIILTLVLAMGVFLAAPATVFAATNYTAGTNAELQAALSALADGDTITLTGMIGLPNNPDPFGFPDPIIVDGIDVTINFNGYSILSYVDSNSPISITNGGKLNLIGEGGINVYSNGTVGIWADNGELSTDGVAEIVAQGSMGGIYATNSSFVRVTYVNGSWGNAVNCNNGSEVWIDGDINSAYGTGVSVENKGRVIVNGVINADPYISFAGDERTIDQYETDPVILNQFALQGFRTYLSNDHDNFVFVGTDRTLPFDTQEGTFSGGGDVIFSLDKDISLFSFLFKVDGEVLNEDVDFSLTEGSTIITLFGSYLNGLTNGTHTFEAHFWDGNFAELTVTISKPQPSTASTSNANNVPQTGERSGIWQFVLLLIAIVGISTLVVIRKRLIKE